MRRLWIPALMLVLLPATALANPQEELDFARRLSFRGLDEMALKVLDDLEKSPDPDAARTGRFGKALLQKQGASIARLRFLRALEEGRSPRVKRADVLVAFDDAKPKIQEYVNSRPNDADARFLLAELLQEHAEFLVGSDYPEELAEERAKLLSENAQIADQLFEAAIEHFGKVYETLRPKLPKDPTLADPTFLQVARARYMRANARMRWAFLYPEGPKFQFRSEQAIEELDEFLAEHFEDIFGGYAMLDLGRCNLERGLRIPKEGDSAQIALDYFSTLYTTLKEDPALPEQGKLVAQAFYWYARTCNALARGDGKLDPQPTYLEKAVASGAELRARLKQGIKLQPALLALLEVAQAYAAQGRYDDAVTLAGDVLATARVEGHVRVSRLATAHLTAWVANVKGAGTLAPSLLFQIGDSLDGQGRVSNAITFFEKAISASETDEDQESWAFPARVRIAKAYRRDSRFFAAAKVAWAVVEDYLESGQEEESPLGQLASDACNVARLSLKRISTLTERSQDVQEYERVLALFRNKFPGHPENADKDFSRAKEAYTDQEYESAASLLKSIGSTSPNYWLAQRMVPQCYRNLAHAADEDDAEAKKWHAKALEAAKEVVQLAEGKASPPAKRARQTGHLFVAMSHASLEQWPEALESIDSYLARYPDEYLKRGLEHKIKVDAHLALDQLDEAEKALTTFRARFPASSYSRRATYDVYAALRTKYQDQGGAQRAATAGRAAKLLEAWVETIKEPDSNLLYFLGDVYYDARRYGDAAEAFDAARDKLPVDEEKRRGAFTLRAAEAQYMAATENKDLSELERREVLDGTRKLFTDVIIPPDPTDPNKTEQTKVIQQLASPKWPPRAVFDKIKRNAPALLTAARIYPEVSPGGVDGRHVALKLIYHLHSFTRPVKTGNEAVDPYVPLWWEAAQMKLEFYTALAESNVGAEAKEYATTGLGFATKILFEHPKMDGEERVRAVKALEAKLKVLAR